MAAKTRVALDKRSASSPHMLTSRESFHGSPGEYGPSLRQTRNTIAELARHHPTEVAVVQGARPVEDSIDLLSAPVKELPRRCAAHRIELVDLPLRAPMSRTCPVCEK
jgi:hypothetical protein